MSAVVASLPAPVITAPQAVIVSPAESGGSAKVFFHPFFPLLHLMHLPHLFLHRPFGGLHGPLGGFHHGLGGLGGFHHGLGGLGGPFGPFRSVPPQFQNLSSGGVVSSAPPGRPSTSSNLVPLPPGAVSFPHLLPPMRGSAAGLSTLPQGHASPPQWQGQLPQPPGLPPSSPHPLPPLQSDGAVPEAGSLLPAPPHGASSFLAHPQTVTRLSALPAEAPDRAVHFPFYAFITPNKKVIPADQLPYVPPYSVPGYTPTGYPFRAQLNSPLKLTPAPLPAPPVPTVTTSSVAAAPAAPEAAAALATPEAAAALATPEAAPAPEAPALTAAFDGPIPIVDVYTSHVERTPPSPAVPTTSTALPPSQASGKPLDIRPTFVCVEEVAHGPAATRVELDHSLGSVTSETPAASGAPSPLVPPPTVPPVREDSNPERPQQRENTDVEDSRSRTSSTVRPGVSSNVSSGVSSSVSADVISSVISKNSSDAGPSDSRVLVPVDEMTGVTPALTSEVPDVPDTTSFEFTTSATSN